MTRIVRHGGEPTSQLASDSEPSSSWSSRSTARLSRQLRVHCQWHPAHWQATSSTSSKVFKLCPLQVRLGRPGNHDPPWHRDRAVNFDVPVSVHCRQAPSQAQAVHCLPVTVLRVTGRLARARRQQASMPVPRAVKASRSEEVVLREPVTVGRCAVGGSPE